MKRIQLDKDKSKHLFYDIKHLGIFLSQMNAIVQNPDFATMEDLKIFRLQCDRFESKYNIIKQSVEELFEKAKVI